jgi:hypothetical protein
MLAQEGVTAEEAGNIATKNAVSIVVGATIWFYLIYRFLIK